jgi:predicted phosphodiesterase
MPTTILNLSDPHFTHRRPRSRTDDYVATQLRKLVWCLDLARERGAAAVTIPGDVFDDPRGPNIRRRLDTALLPLLLGAPCPIYAIRGNHDLLHDRVESLREHPLGTLELIGAIRNLHPPAHAVVGVDPPVLLVGYDYSRDGPFAWLDSLVAEETVRRLRGLTGAVGCVALSHAYWGDDGTRHGERVVAPGCLARTGVDVVVHGHDHTFGGLLACELEGRECWVVGPGALCRGSLGWDDRTRQPRVALITFHADGRKDAEFVVVPHEPAAAVFDLEAHDRRKAYERDLGDLVAGLKALGPETGTTEDPLDPFVGEVVSRVLDRVRDFLRRAAPQHD